jgi:thioredoxin reductase
MFDAIVVGGSFAGISAALQLARARRRIAVIDAGKRRNRFAATSHGFLGQDGRAPGDIIADARAQLLAYPTVEWVDGEAEGAAGEADGFSVKVAGGQTLEARRLILATGVTDELPAVPGLAERWGKSVFHCPYCHGYELGGGEVGVLAVSPMSMHHALMLPDWGRTTFFLNGTFEPDEGQMAELEKRGVSVEREPIERIAGAHADVELRDGRVVRLNGLFTVTRTKPSSPLAEQLGCAAEEGPIGPFVRTDGFKETSVPGVFASGDAARAMGSVAFAVADGAMSGASAHQSLMFRERAP